MTAQEVKEIRQKTWHSPSVQAEVVSQHRQLRQGEAGESAAACHPKQT